MPRVRACPLVGHRNASLDSLKARKRIGPRVNEVLTINDGTHGCTSFWLVHGLRGVSAKRVATRDTLEYSVYYLYYRAARMRGKVRI